MGLGRLGGAVSRLSVRAAVAALAALGLVLSSGGLVEQRASAAIEVGAHITLAFEPGCEGSGTYEVVNETKGVVQHRAAATWSASEPIHVVDGSGGIADRGDRLVVRLLDADGRLLFAAPAQFLDDVIVRQERLPDYLLLVQLDCSTLPYEVTYHLSYPVPAASPATSTAEPAQERPSSSSPVLLLLFGLGLVVGSLFVGRRRRRSETVAPPRCSGSCGSVG